MGSDGLPTTPGASSTTAIALSVISYSVCSGSLLFLNKLLLTLIPSPPLMTAIQCLVVLVSVGGSAALFGSPRLGAWPPSAAVLRAYAAYSALFVAGIYTNMRALEVSNVDTVIVFRSAVPLIVAAGDWALMGRAAPSPRSALALLAVIGGCAAYVSVDAAFHVAGVRAYGWVAVYCFCIAAEMLLGKSITSRHDVSLGDSVLITNGFALLPFLAIGAATGELARGLDATLYTPTACAVLAASCLLSAGIGFTGWWARSLISATSFTVIGTVNKVLTVLINIMFWNKHASALGTFFLLTCLAGGAAYQQAPMRAAAAGYAQAGDKAGEAASGAAAAGADDRARAQAPELAEEAVGVELAPAATLRASAAANAAV